MLLQLGCLLERNKGGKEGHARTTMDGDHDHHRLLLVLLRMMGERQTITILML